MRRRLAALVLALCCGSCGRYVAPIAPELMAPRSVDDLVITPSPQGVGFAWVAPDEDRRGKELMSSNGYRIRRKQLVERGDETDDSVPFKAVGFVADTHVEVREKLRAEARAQGKIGRRIEAPEELTRFSFVDTTPERDKTYLYKIVPENQGSVEGLADQLIRVTFKGAESDVTIVASEEVETLAPRTPDEQRSER